MKVNAPEKIYVNIPWNYWHTGPEKVESDTEYTRTDAFIEKACELLTNMVLEVAYRNPNDPNNDYVLNDTVMGFIKDFRRNMEGE